MASTHLAIWKVKQWHVQTLLNISSEEETPPPPVTPCWECLLDRCRSLLQFLGLENFLLVTFKNVLDTLPTISVERLRLGFLKETLGSSTKTHRYYQTYQFRGSPRVHSPVQWRGSLCTALSVPHPLGDCCDPRSTMANAERAHRWEPLAW